MYASCISKVQGEGWNRAPAALASSQMTPGDDFSERRVGTEVDIIEMGWAEVSNEIPQSWFAVLVWITLSKAITVGPAADSRTLHSSSNESVMLRETGFI